MEKPVRERCQAEVIRYVGSWPKGYRCSRYAVNGGYCKQHHPDAVKEREAARRAKYNREDAARTRRYGRSAVFPQVVNALKAARDTLEELNQFEDTNVDELLDRISDALATAHPYMD